MRRLIRFVALLTLVLLIIALAISAWYFNRPRPNDTTEDLFQGVTYIRDVRNEPRPINIHLIKIDLAAPDIAFLVTPGTPESESPLIARKTTTFLSEFDLQVAINGDFFEPVYAGSALTYYISGDNGMTVLGFAASRGSIYSQGSRRYATFYISAQNHVSITRPPASEIYNAISGSLLFISGGLVTLPQHQLKYMRELHPRSALGVDQSGRYLFLVVIDGRQTNFSEGVTLAELGEIMLEYGVFNALNLDGGRSSTLVVEGVDGQPHILNSPIDNLVPGQERPVANHLGVYARLK